MTTPVNFPSPGLAGLNKAESQIPLKPAWATQASNVVIDDAGRFAARKGWVKQTSSAISAVPGIEALHEYENASGTATLIAAAANKLYESSDNGITLTDRTAALTVTANKWQFQNFNGKVLAAQVGHDMLVKTTGNFAIVAASSGTIPNKPVAVLAAFGRVWCIESDLQTIKYSALLDETKYATADGGGIIDMRTVWTQGMDTAIAIKAFGGRLVVFGKRHIVPWVDGAGAALGLDPTNIYVEDMIEACGTVARDSVQNIGEGDLVFLSQNGIRSLTRVLQEQQTPIADITQHSRQYFNTLLLNSNVDQTKTRSVYSPDEGFYLLICPSAMTTVCVDIRDPLGDGSFRITEWPGFTPTSACRRTNGAVMFGFPGVVGQYSGYTDNGASYQYVFRSGFLDLGDEVNNQLKFLKRVAVKALVVGSITAFVKWWWDFKDEAYFDYITYDPQNIAEYGIAEYGLAEYSGSGSQRSDTAAGAGSGQYLQIGIEAQINGNPFALQTLTAFFDAGRFA